MPLLTLERISHAYGHLPLLDAADLRVEPGERIALIGRNGTGKSTLLRIISGQTAPDGGRVWLAPGTRVARLAQEVPRDAPGTVREALAARVVPAPGADAWDAGHKVDVVLSRLSLSGDSPLAELSGGWRRRVLLGQALVSDPDLLLLDEPTNHLDIDAIGWLEAFVRDFAGAIIFVTHDRMFLGRVATRIVELDRGRLTSWPGTYDEYLAKKEAALENEARDLARLDRKLAEEEAWLRQGVKARRTRNEGRVRALAALRDERAARRGLQGQVRMSIEGESSGKLVFEARDVTFGYGATPILRNFSTRILRGDRVGLIGSNGSGKTTLLRLLAGEIEPQSGEIRRGARLQIAYFDQQRRQLDPDSTVAACVADGDFLTVNGRSRHVIGYLADFLFPRERALAPVRALSGGELNRLLLARLFARPANVLVLDEPTNDLDIETLELLEELIADFDGTVLLVTHDRAFLDDVVTSTIAFEGAGRVMEYVGGWQDYLRQTDGRSRVGSAGAAPPVQGKAPRPPAQSQRSSFEGPRRRTYKEEREYETLPERIDSLEREQHALQREMAHPDFYKSPPERIREVLARSDAIQVEIDEALSRWIALEEIRK